MSAVPRKLLDKLGKPSVPGLPKYAQLREILYSAISSGHWKPGARLPTETELASVTPFSLGTVQRAMRALVDEGLIVRTQGTGSFVAEGRAPLDAPLHLRFPREDGEGFLPLFPKLLVRTRISERGPWSECLGQEGDNIVRIDRRLSVNGEFNLYNRFYVNADKFAAVATRPVAALDGVNIKELLASELNMPVTHVEQRVYTRKFDAGICKAIGVKSGTVGLVLESAASAGRGNCIYYLESFIPPTHHKLDVSAT
jgi:DNA-binding GntR family transcriptional regulator